MFGLTDLKEYSPWNATAFHVIGQSDVVWPYVELPLPESQYSAMDASGVDTDAHVNIDGHHLPDQTVQTTTKDVIKLSQEDWLGVSKQLPKEEMEIGK